MKKTKIVSIFLALAMLTSCSVNGQETTLESTETTTVATTTTIPTTTTTTSETPTSTTRDPDLVAFNPHVQTKLLSEVVTEDMWNTLHEMIDAIRSGRETFKCKDEETYKWCTAQPVMGMFLPPSQTYVKAAGYQDGVGKIKYLLDKRIYQEREQNFEKEVEGILKSAVRPGYSDFEKIMGLYDYVCKHFKYDYSLQINTTVDDYSVYACLMSRMGTCRELAETFTYLLLQVGVEAINISVKGHHMWTYVLLGGKGYHVDPTWGLQGDESYGNLTLNFFMLTDQERITNGFDKDTFKVNQLKKWKKDYDMSRFPATDEFFKDLHMACCFLTMDTEKNVLIYYDAYRNQLEFDYGDL